MAKAEEPKEGEAVAAKPKSKKKLIIIVVVLLLLVGGGAGFFLMKGSAPQEGEGEPKEEVEKPKEFKKIKLDTIIVNLSEAKSFLKVSLLFEYDADLLHKVTAGAEGKGEGHGGGGSGGEEGGAAEGGFPPEMIEKQPIIQDMLIRVLSSKTPADVLSPAGKQALKDELIEAMNEVLEFSEPVIVNVYFTEFIIQ